MRTPIVSTVVEPWTAAGPGWANAGVTLWHTHRDGSLSQQTVYTKDMDAVQAALFPVALRAYEALAQAMKSRRKGKAA